MEIQRYLKTGSEFKRGSEVMQRNTDIVQAVNESLIIRIEISNKRLKFQLILNHMRHYGYS